MNITHISTSDNAGGASRAAYRLHLGLQAAGHTSRMVVGYRTAESSDVHALISDARPGWRVLHAAIYRAANLISLQYLIPWPPQLLSHSFIRSADIVNLHNTHGSYFSHTFLPQLSKQCPIVWTLHDMWALTGHCPYSYGCERWTTGCGKCPLPGDYPAVRADSTALLWKVKDWLYARSDITVVAPSRWLADLARRSPLLGRFPVHHIPYGLDLEVFRPLDKSVARELLGLPREGLLIMFAAQDMTERRKGTGAFLEALGYLKEQMPQHTGVVTMGGGGTTLQLPVPLPWWHLGRITDDRLLRAAYSAADLFVCSSPVDNLPNTVLESFACGTPVVGFNVGGIPDMIGHLETGYLAQPDEVDDLANGIRQLLQDGELRIRLGHSARRKAELEYGLEIQARRYSELYRELLSRRKGSLVATAEK